MASIYSLPLSTNRGPNVITETDILHRKRKLETAQSDREPEHNLASIEEYTAVLTPEERSQRRLAGYSLSSGTPTFPFPHARLREKEGEIPQNITTTSPIAEEQRTTGTHVSLQLQHLSCLTTILHRSLLDRDFIRAGRAFGLILRKDIFGHALDIRSAGNWAIGAEILLHRSASERYPRSTNSDAVSEPRDGTGRVMTTSITRQGFQEAKDYYEMLVIRYPYNKTWPESTNAVDFYLAMFNLWVFSVHQARKEAAIERSEGNSPDVYYNQSRVVRNAACVQELEGANTIAARMDQLMTGVPYNDNREMIRLRAMVALWQADLNNECSMEITFMTAGSFDKSFALENLDTNIAEEDNLHKDNHSAQQQYLQEEIRARETAHRLFNKLNGLRDHNG